MKSFLGTKIILIIYVDLKIICFFLILFGYPKFMNRLKHLLE